ncbi:hypothetical protein M8494_27910 [Serratia ureilytica]
MRPRSCCSASSPAPLTSSARRTTARAQPSDPPVRRSPMVANQPSRYPLLLDELLIPATLYQAGGVDAYRSELRQYPALRVPEDDEEQSRRRCASSKQAQQRASPQRDIAGALPVMKVSDHPDPIWREAIIDAVVQQACPWFCATASRTSAGARRRGFAGASATASWAAGSGCYSSDLDLVFLLDCPPEVMTDGDRCIDGRQFLPAAGAAGDGVRSAPALLRHSVWRWTRVCGPSGAAGMLVSTVEAFADTAQNEARPHQALRARIVHGDPAPHQQFDAIRREIL